ncbi:MAG: hypothetical protein H0V37_11505 [Chloroflexia bacterium]|nr:hypothetical protein [Chloroflexia bacterium]
MKRLFTLIAACLLFALVAPAAALAQEATASHLLVGSWVLDTDTDPASPENPPSLARFSADGGYVQIDADGVNALGAWEPTGDATANLTIMFVDEEEGITTVRASVDVAADGQTFTASYTLEFLDPSTGELSGQIGPGTAEGTRMVVEGPGDPVTSFEEAFSEYEGTPEATPTP